MNKLLKSVLSLSMALALMFSLGTTAFADDWYIGDGNITVNASVDGEGNQTQCVSQADGKQNVSDSAPVIKGGTESNPNATSSNTVTINATAGAEANVTLSGVSIDTSDKGTAAITVNAGDNSNVNIELDGNNTVQSGSKHAGIEKNGDSNKTGTLTIKDDNDKEGSLTATGGSTGAGIGGGRGGSGEKITIAGGNVTANGGFGGAGIGGGWNDFNDKNSTGNGNEITITGGTVNANGGDGAAGIGGGLGGNATNISIEGGDVTANGGSSPHDGNSDDADYVGAFGGAGIGGGAARYSTEGTTGGNASGISISNATVKATGSYGAAGIGGGAGVYANEDFGTHAGSCTQITIFGNANVTATGGQSATVTAEDDEDISATIAAGTAIGNGSTTTTGTSVTPDTKELTGWVELKYENTTLNETIENKPETPAGDSSSTGGEGSSTGGEGSSTGGEGSSTGGSSATDSSSATSATLISMGTISSESSPLPVRYYVVTGAEQTWLADSEDGLEFTLNSDSVNVLKVLIDGEEVEFEINDNGDIVISAEVLQALESGAHEIEFVFPDGSCKANFTVK